MSTRFKLGATRIQQIVILPDIVLIRDINGAVFDLSSVLYTPEYFVTHDV